MSQLVLLVAFLGILWAQARIGVVLAPQATSAKGEMRKDYFVTGFAGGISGEVFFTEMAVIGMDLLGSLAGWREEEGGAAQTTTRSTNRLLTLQVPLYVRVQWLPIGEAGAGLTASVGAQADILLSARSKPDGGSFSNNASLYNRYAGSLLGGLGFSYEGDTPFAVDLRTAYSFINIKSSKGGRINPLWFTLRLAFYFGG
ncbi:MAG: PorT family protein [Bacteroidia bacterium]|nr:PorT family protein [Bacteroidia bacterium]